MIRCAWCPSWRKGRSVHPVSIMGKTILLCDEHKAEYIERLEIQTESAKKFQTRTVRPVYSTTECF